MKFLCKLGIHRKKGERKTQMIIPPFWHMSELYCLDCKKTLKYGNEEEMKILAGRIKGRVQF